MYYELSFMNENKKEKIAGHCGGISDFLIILQDLKVKYKNAVNLNFTIKGDNE